MKTRGQELLHVKIFFVLMLNVGCCSYSAVLFTDNFDSGPSSLWGNQSGSWTAVGGVYAAGAPNNAPNAFSALPFSLTNFSVDVDIQGVSDGGIWLRCTPVPGTAVGIEGVLLVLKYADFGAGVKVYWHVAADGSDYGPALNLNISSIAPGSNPHVRVEVAGDTYSAFINGATNPITTLTTSAFTYGQVALYDFSSQTFDNFVLQSPGGVAASVPSVTAPFVQVRWQSVFGSWYQLQSASTKAESKWTNLGSPLPGNGGEMSLLVEATQQAKFFRVQLLQ